MKKSIGASLAGMKSGNQPGPYCPDEGDIVWLEFSPTHGHEQRGRRPAIVLSPRAYNRLAKLCLACPITNTTRGFPFEVSLPAGGKTIGAILANQVRSLSWADRGSEFTERAPAQAMAETRAKVKSLALIS